MWKTKNLGDVCRVIGGGTPPKDRADYYSGDIPWATVRDMRHEIITETECRITEQAVKSSATNIIPKGNVVIATRVGLGKVCILGQDTAINQDLRGIVPNNIKIVGVRFLFWWLKTIAHLIEEEGTGATVKGVKLPFVKSLQVPLPPLPEQQRIVAILDEAFDAIATAKANAEKNLQNARALFESGLNAAIAGKLTQDWRGAHPNTESASEHVKKKLTQRRSQWRGKGKYKEPDPPVANKPVDIPKTWTLASPEQISTHIVDCPHSTPNGRNQEWYACAQPTLSLDFSIWSPCSSYRRKPTNSESCG